MVLLPILHHMPLHIKEKIIKPLDLDQKTRLRRCCKEFKTIVDKSRTSFKEFIVSSTQYGYKLKITEGLIENEIKFDRDPFETQTCWRIFQKIEPGSPDEDGISDLIISRSVTHLLENTEALDALFDVIGFLFRDVSRLAIEKFGYSYNIEDIISFPNKFKVVLSTMKGGLLSVEHLEMTNAVIPTEIFKVISYLKPGTLQRFTFCSFCDFETNGIRQLEQWQRAVCLDTRKKPHVLDYDRVSHFKFAAVYSFQPSLQEIQQIIRKIEDHADQFEMLHIDGWMVADVKNYIEAISQPLCGDPRYRYKKHPNLDFSIRFYFGRFSLQMRRVSSITFKLTDERFQDIC